jgi:multidrug resistance efflux pump
MMSAYRPLRVFGVVGLVLLVASMAGAIFALNPGQVDASKMMLPTPVHEKSVVCYGVVDVPQGVTALFPLQAGRVVEVKVQDNDLVKAGDPLLRVDDRLASFRVREAEADHRAAQAQLDQARHLPDQQRAKLAQQQAGLAATRAKLAAARYQLQRVKELEKINQKNKEEVGAAAELVKEAEAAEQADLEKLKELQTIDPSNQVTRAEADVSAKQARLEQARLALDECTLKAPQDGQVLQVLVGVGSLLSGQPNQPVMVFCPGTTRVVRAEVEQEFASRISLGQQVSIQDEAAIAGTIWTGKVLRLSDWFTFRRPLGQEPMRLTNNDVRMLECLIAIDQAPDQPKLRIGQRVRVTTGRAN